MIIQSSIHCLQTSRYTASNITKLETANNTQTDNHSQFNIHN